MSLENKIDCFFLISHLAAPRPTLTLKDMLNKKNYVLKMMLLHPNLATNSRVIFKLCSLLITTLTYHESKTWYIYLAGRAGIVPTKMVPTPPAHQLNMKKPSALPLLNQNVPGPSFCNFFAFFQASPCWGRGGGRCLSWYMHVLNSD